MRLCLEPSSTNPKVNVTPVDTGDRIVLELRVADDDMGRVIGRGGRRAQAMRSIIKAKRRVVVFVHS